MEKVITEPGISIAKILRENGEREAITTLSVEISALNRLANESSKMSPEIIEATAIEILREYKLMKLEELRFALHQGAIGRFGQLYGAIDGFKILWWISEFDKRRMDYFDDKMERESNDRKELR